MKLSRAIQLWVEEVRAVHAAATAAAYESDLHRLLAMARVDTILAFTPELVRLYFTTASAQGMQPSTLHRKMASVREFSRWGILRRLWHENPMDTLPRVPRPQALPRPFTRDEVLRLLALELAPLERLLRALLLFTGLRVTPICSLKVGDVSYDPPTVRALVKGARVQVVPMHPQLRDLVQSYVLAHTDLKGQSPLLARPNGRPLHRRTVERLTSVWGQRVDVPQCLPHRFRHTFATALLEAGVDIRLIKDALGHRDIGSTMVYTRVSDEALHRSVQRLPWSLE